ncbi:hypothetical protein ONZ51_g5420 [Trametes cubensis]|uniref:Uncharacterized protein n=1 Tax=Trametes cubensis TaxID=1111947 RepID=A0AAD7TU96_9APHY|nr:hypothetical protein ONZ51_g5420 [Trametes cubensis]
MDRAFNVNKRLSRYFRDPSAFRSLQARTATVISGSFALQFFDRTFYPESDLDLYVHPNPLVLDVGLYLDTEGYIFQPQPWQEETWQAEIEYLCGTMRQPIDEIEDPGELSTLYPLKSTRAVYTFVQKPAADADTEGPRKVQIIVSRSSPLGAILDFHSTCVMNAITYNAAYALFPLPTLEHCTSLIINGANPSSHEALEKYTRRGWRTIANSSPLLPFLDPHWFHFNKIRWVCDVHTWTIPLSTTDVTPPPRASPSSDALSWDPFAESGWTLRYGPGKSAAPDFGIVSTKILRWGYTTPNEEYLDMLVDFFISQGRVEFSKLPQGGKDPEDHQDVWTWWDPIMPLFRAQYLKRLENGAAAAG